MLTPRNERWGLAFSLVVFAVPLAIYALSIMPSVGFWDTAEMQTVPYIFGVAHPPGFPVFIILGYLFSHLFAFGNVAWRLSMMCAIAMSGAAWFAFRTLKDQRVHPILGCLCAWAFAFGSIVWTRGTRAEVHALAIFFIAMAVWAALRARESGERAPLYICALSLGLAAATHPVMIWIVPGMAVLLAPVFRELWRANLGNDVHPARVTALTIGLMIVPLLLYFYMPLRSAIVTAQHMDPTLALGIPPGQPFWDYGHTADPHRFILQLTGAQFQKNYALTALLRLSQYPSLAPMFAALAWAELGPLMLLLAVAGALRLLVRDRVGLLGITLITLAGVPFALTYWLEIDPERYLLTAYLGSTILAGIGAQALVALTQSRVQHRIALTLTGIILCESVAYDFKTNWQVWQQRNDRSADAFVDRIIQETPPNSVIVAPWVFATPLGYAAYVERRLGDRIVETAQPFVPPVPLLPLARKRPVFVLYFETTPRPIPGVRQVAVDVRNPALYRIVPSR